ncbi:hypothetical protein [Clavibacter sp. CFBP 8614]|uniref:hypothetical protein n=1 Tax=unclassified Clavibacter TaxID=2626594 RepID=UPI0040430BA9
MVSSPRRSTPARRRRPAPRGPAEAAVGAPGTALAPDAPHPASTAAASAAASAAAPSTAPSTASAAAAHPLLRALAAVTIVALALRIPLQQGLEVGHVLAVVLAPLWIPRLARYRGAVVVAGAIVLAVGAGLWLTEASRGDHVVSRTETTYVTVMVLGLLAGIGVLLWARTLMRDATVAVWFGVGMLAGVNPSSTLFSSNPWKFGLTVPVTVLVLALAWRWGSRRAAAVALVVLVVLAGLNDARSELAILLLVLLVVLWEMRPSTPGRRGSVALTLLGLGGLALVVSQVGQALILEGYLGEATRQRTEAQLDESGSVITGGRPEVGAFVALLRAHPWGFGSGTFPTSTELGIAKTGMAALGYDPDNGYVEDYLFGEGFELHSLVGDLWTRFGLIGIALSVVILVVVLTGAARSVAHRAGAAVLVYVAVKTLWNLPFSPLYSSIPLLVLAVGLCLIPRAADPATARGEPSGADPARTRTRTRPRTRPARSPHGPLDA